MSADKWTAYYAGPTPPPWESGAPVSQLVAAVRSGALRPSGPAAEIGCGSGASTIYLRQAGWAPVYGLDICDAALDRARQRETVENGAQAACAYEQAPRGSAAALGAAPADCALLDGTTPQGGRVQWVNADLLDPADIAPFAGLFNFVFDCQTYHAVRSEANADRLAAAIASLLAPGGRYFVLTGNADEPPRTPGPTVLTREQLVAPFEAAGLRLESLEACRFDATSAYGSCPPLAWCANFVKPAAP
jgi:SAM-dependent methyltransferase